MQIICKQVKHDEVHCAGTTDYRLYGRRSKYVDAGLDCASTGCTAALSVTQSTTAAAVCGAVYVQYVFAL